MEGITCPSHLNVRSMLHLISSSIGWLWVQHMPACAMTGTKVHTHHVAEDPRPFQQAHLPHTAQLRAIAAVTVFGFPGSHRHGKPHASLSLGIVNSSF